MAQYLPLLFFLAVAGFSSANAAPSPGRWTPIGNINDPNIKELAEWAVGIYDREWSVNLALQEVVGGETQAAGDKATNYRLHLNTTQGAYVAVIWVPQDKLTPYKLISFSRDQP